MGMIDQAWHQSVFTDGHFHAPAAGGTLPVRDRATGEIAAVAGLAAPLAPGRLRAAVATANETEYGLVNSVLTGDPYRGIRLARQLRAGMVHDNDATPQDEALAPFGGIGRSGLGGQSGGDANMEEFTERRWLTVTEGPAHYPY
jgi:benzaldehyde dehydrogenase (NAD)